MVTPHWFPQPTGAQQVTPLQTWPAGQLLHVSVCPETQTLATVVLQAPAGQLVSLQHEPTWPGVVGVPGGPPTMHDWPPPQLQLRVPPQPSSSCAPHWPG